MEQGGGQVGDAERISQKHPCECRWYSALRPMPLRRVFDGSAWAVREPLDWPPQVARPGTTSRGQSWEALEHKVVVVPSCAVGGCSGLRAGLAAKAKHGSIGGGRGGVLEATLTLTEAVGNAVGDAVLPLGVRRATTDGALSPKKYHLDIPITSQKPNWTFRVALASAYRWLRPRKPSTKVSIMGHTAPPLRRDSRKSAIVLQ